MIILARPSHSFKFAATLQNRQRGTEPVLIRIDTDQGHGAAGSSLSKTIDEETDKWSFLFYKIERKTNLSLSWIG
jgi:prolyl oligopeptidase